ncbi:hypothetical protein ACN47E_003823 [Coniothyrium glycines]
MPVERVTSSASWREKANAERAYRQRQQTSTYEGGVDDRKQSGSGPDCRIYVGNMPYTAQRSDIEHFLEAEGFSIVNLDISIDPFTQRNPSYCFVDMRDAQTAASAIRMLSGKMFLGRPLKVKPGVQKRPRNNLRYPDVLESTRWQSTSREQEVLQHGGKPNSVTSLEDPVLPIREKRRLFVGNLPRPVDHHASDTEIREIFHGFYVEAVSKVKWPSHGRSQEQAWYAFVDLTSSEEAQRAIRQLDGAEMFGEELVVRLATSAPENMNASV